VLIGYYNYGETADMYGKMTPAQRQERAIMLGEKIYGPKYRTEFASSFSQSWRYIPHLEGAWHNIPDGGPDSPTLKPLAYPTGKTYFAGDWLSYLDAWQHGAITSARSAVTQLHKQQLSLSTSAAPR
jgi:monoamine oxidase